MLAISRYRWGMKLVFPYLILIIAVTIMVSVEAKGGRGGGRGRRYSRGSGGGLSTDLEVWEIILIVIGVLVGSVFLCACIIGCCIGLCSDDDDKKSTDDNSIHNENETCLINHQTNMNIPSTSNGASGGAMEMTTNRDFSSLPPPSYEEVARM